jgi:histidyl-tRNA synthetase
METIKDTCYKGTRIILGNEKRNLINCFSEYLKNKGFTEIQIPIIQLQEIFSDKVGEENNNLMFNFKDRGDRDLCLAPEYTAIIQQLAKTYFKQEKDVMLFYVQECFRGEKPQAGRYRQFTQFGVEILNPTKDYSDFIKKIALDLFNNESGITNKFELNSDVTRGLDYYKEGKGFEISCEELGSSKQVCGGGEYDGGIGFAIGIDRLINLPITTTVAPFKYYTAGWDDGPVNYVPSEKQLIISTFEAENGYKNITLKQKMDFAEIFSKVLSIPKKTYLKF